MRQKTDKKPAAAKPRYKDHFDPPVRVKTLFGPVKHLSVVCLPLAITAAHRILDYSYPKLFQQKLGPHQIPSSSTETVTIDEEGIPSTISTDQASLVPQSKIDVSAAGAIASH